MRLHCEVEVRNQHLPALGLKARGKGVRAVVSLCQPPRRSALQPGAGAESDGRACLLVSTMKDRQGTRYELRENIEQLFTKFVDEGKATVRLKEPPVDICLSKLGTNLEIYLLNLKCCPWSTWIFLEILLKNQKSSQL